MKRLIPAFVLFASVMLFSAETIHAEAPIPDMTGNWTAKNYAHHHEKRGFFTNPEADGKWVIKEQQGRFFYGERTYTMKQVDPAKVVKEGFSGVISRDYTRLYIVDHDEDILLGDFLPDGSIELIMINDGDKDHHSKIGVLELVRAPKK